MKQEIKNEFQSDLWKWLIGFAEGDGCLHTNGRRHWFILTQKENRVLYRARSIIGFGKIQKVEKRCEPSSDPGSNGRLKQIYYRLVITNREGIQKLIQAFNGQFVCEARKVQLSRWIATWNARFPQQQIVEQPSFTQPTLNHAWFSGFFDAEGDFSISITKRNRKYRVRPRIFCDQKNEREVLRTIVAMFQAGRVTARGQDRTHYRWMVDTWVHVEKIQAYFRRYPLRTRKHLVYLRWLKVYRMVLRKEHLTEIGLKRIRQLCTCLQSGTFQ